MHARFGVTGFIGAAGLLALAGMPACSAVLGIKDLPAPADAGGGGSGAEDDTGASGAGSGTTGASGASSGTDVGTGVPDAGRGGTPDASDPAAAFLGTWGLTVGTQALSNCTDPNANMGPAAEPTTIVLIWERGTTTDLFGTYAGAGSSGCTIAANIQNGVAIGVPGQTCTETSPSETDIITLVSSAFVISGNTAHTMVQATDREEGTTLTCDITDDATYVRR